MDTLVSCIVRWYEISICSDDGHYLVVVRNAISGELVWSSGFMSMGGAEWIFDTLKLSAERVSADSAIKSIGVLLNVQQNDYHQSHMDQPDDSPEMIIC